MKNRFFKLMVATIATTTFFSCSQSDELSHEVEQVNVAQEDNLIERNILNLSSVDAAKLAKQFSINEYEGGSRTASDVSVKDVHAVISDSGEPLMYVVNYADNQGFTVISATKNYTPVLAYSDEGYLDVNDASFTENIFMDEYKTYIESVVNVESDSLRQRYAIDWSFYEKKPEAVNSRVYTDAQIQQELNNARTYYMNQGYEVHSLNAATSLMQSAGGQTGEQRANGFINDICSRTPHQYDCMDVTLLLVKRTYDQYGPYLQTAWHQDYPYAVGTPYLTAGCMKIAVTQMMYYYKWPTNAFNWNNIRVNWGDELSDPTAEEMRFMTEVGSKLNQTYVAENQTQISLPHLIPTFEHYDYAIEEKVYSRKTAMEYIKSRIPLIMYGRKSSHDSHVWICDGYRNPKVQFAVHMIDRDFGEYTFYPGLTDDLGEYFHMNMGDGFNIWYYQDNATYGGDSYSIDRKMYPVIPNTTN